MLQLVSATYSCCWYTCLCTDEANVTAGCAAVNMPERLPSIPSPMLMPEALPRLVEQPRMLMPEALPRLLEQPRMLMPEVLPPVPTPVGRPVLHQVEGSRCVLSCNVFVLYIR